MATKTTKTPETDVTQETEMEVAQPADIDVTKTRVKIMLPRPRPGEETQRFFSNGRENVLVKCGVEVEVPYWVAERLRQSEAAEMRAYIYETATEKRAGAF